MQIVKISATSTFEKRATKLFILFTYRAYIPSLSKTVEVILVLKCPISLISNNQDKYLWRSSMCRKSKSNL